MGDCHGKSGVKASEPLSPCRGSQRQTSAVGLSFDAPR